MSRKRTFLATFVTGLLLAGVPLVAIARHNYVQEKDVRFSVNSTISPRADTENFDIWSEINMLDLASMSGNDKFLRGQTVYVHMSQGPDNIAYPFAVTTKRPEHIEEQIFTIKGQVMGREDDLLMVRYNFETFLPPNDLKTIIRQNPGSQSRSVLAINNQGIARLISVEVEGQIFPYRNTDNFALNGWTQ